MKTETPLRDFYNRIIGYIIEDEDGNKTILDFYRRKLGTYNKASNLTRDFYNKIIGRGDLSAMLINMNNNK